MLLSGSGSIPVLGHVFELVPGPGRNGVNVAVLVAHEIKLAGGNCHRLGADAKKAADVYDDLRARAGTVNVRQGAGVLVGRPVDGGAFQVGGVQFRFGGPNVLAVSMGTLLEGWTRSTHEKSNRSGKAHETAGRSAA